MIDYIQSNVNQIKNQIIVNKLLGFRVVVFYSRYFNWFRIIWIKNILEASE